MKRSEKLLTVLRLSTQQAVERSVTVDGLTARASSLARRLDPSAPAAALLQRTVLGLRVDDVWHRALLLERKG